MKKLAIVLTHPIQYYAPVFKLLSQSPEIQVKVFYTWGEDSVKPKFDPGFGKIISWDVPLLEGYEYEFLKNTSQNPGSSHYKGIINPEILTRIDNFSPHCILVYGWKYQSHLKLLRYYKGKKTLWFRGDSTLLDDVPGWKTTIRRLFLRWVYSHVDKVLYVGTANKLYFKAMGLKTGQFVHVPHAIDNKRFGEDRKAEANQLRSELGLSPGSKLVLFAGKLEPKKNPELLLNAFLSLGDAQTHLLFVGNGALEDYLKAKVFELQNRSSAFNNRIHFKPFQNQKVMPAYYQAADVFCLPSKGPGETWGLAVNEALAAGTPAVVSTKVGCFSDMEKTNGAISFLSEDVDDLTEKIKIQLKKGKIVWDGRNLFSIETQVQNILKEL